MQVNIDAGNRPAPRRSGKASAFKHVLANLLSPEILQHQLQAAADHANFLEEVSSIRYGRILKP